MIWTSKISPLVKEVELRKPPIIVKVNKFTEESAKKFHQDVENVPLKLKLYNMFYFIVMHITNNVTNYFKISNN